jgi:glutaredoxin
MKIEIYSKSQCPFCVKAKAYLEKHGLAYTELSIESDPLNQQRYTALGLEGKARTVPQIIVDGVRLGGYTDLLVSDVVKRFKAAQ